MSIYVQVAMNINAFARGVQSVAPDVIVNVSTCVISMHDVVRNMCNQCGVRSPVLWVRGFILMLNV
jgi:hypothetical protein